MDMHSAGRLSIIIPTLNEARELGARLLALQYLRKQGHEVLLVDGGSVDETIPIAQALVDRILVCQPGRALQMNRGAAIARGDLLLFLHADTQLPANVDVIIGAWLGHYHWGRFDVQIAGTLRGLRWVAWCMNWRSRLTGIATGDQALFITKKAFDAVGGYPELPLMEDIALSKRLKVSHGRPCCLRATVVTSGRRWQTYGLVRTVLLMWTLRLAYFCGVDARWLARAYGYAVPGR